MQRALGSLACDFSYAQIECGDLIVSVSGKLEHLAVDRDFAQILRSIGRN